MAGQIKKAFDRVVHDRSRRGMDAGLTVFKETMFAVAIIIVLSDMMGFRVRCFFDRPARTLIRLSVGLEPRR